MSTDHSLNDSESEIETLNESQGSIKQVETCKSHNSVMPFSNPDEEEEKTKNNHRAYTPTMSQYGFAMDNDLTPTHSAEYMLKSHQNIFFDTAAPVSQKCTESQSHLSLISNKNYEKSKKTVVLLRSALN